MRASARFVCLFTLVALPAAAQSTTEDGIRATLGGDYQTAVRILRPLAVDAAHPDPLAQFFLAILDDTGHAGNSARACGLFLSAARRTNPFSEQSAAIAELLREEFGSGASLLCVAEETWQGGPPHSFALGPNHRIVFADTSITVTQADREQRTPLILSSGTTFLPIRYTPLDVTRPIAARRHFFLWFSWTPDMIAKPSSWTLGWMLSEVVGDQWMPITGDTLVEVHSPTMPASYDVTNLVRLRVNANGEAEYTIDRGSSPRTAVIPWKESR